jgi:tetratricopeptide (TPR) repeat protein
MPTEGEGFDRLLRWFRQRRLLQVLAIYLGASWLILEITDVFIDKLALPPWFFPAAIVLLLIGLVVVVATAIIEGATVVAPAAELQARAPDVAAERRQRSMWTRALLGAAAVAVVLVIVGSVLTVLDRDDAPPVVDPSLKSLAVLPFRTSGPELELWREGLMDVLSTNLDDVADLHTIDTRTVLSRWRSRIGDREATEAQALEVANRLGARWAISGQIVELGGQVRLDASLHSASSGETLGSASLAAVPDSILALVDQLSIQLLREVGEEEGLRASTRALSAHSLEAVRAYLEGEQALRRVQTDRAIEAFQRALDADSTFALAAHGLSHAYGWRYHLGNPESLDAEARAVRMAERLPPRERALVETAYLLSQELTAAIERARELTVRYPDDPEAWYLLGDAYYHLGYRVGISKRDRLAPFDRAIALDSSYLPAVLHPLEYSLDLDELERFDRLTRLFLSHDSTSRHGRALHITRDLVRGSPEDSLAALSSLADQEQGVLTRTFIFLWGPPRLAPLAARLATEMAAPRFSVAQRFTALNSYVARIEQWRGRLAATVQAYEDAEALMPANSAIYVSWLFWYMSGRGDAERAARSVERLVSRDDPILQAPMFRAVMGWYHAMSGNPDGLTAQLDTLAFVAGRFRAAGNSLLADRADAASRTLQGLLASRRGDHIEAAAANREAADLIDGPNMAVAHGFLRYSRATSLLEAGEDAEALEVLETFDGFGLADGQSAFLRARLYEERGEIQQAIRAYARVVELWIDCDPELRETWEAAQRALERLTAET